MQTVTVHEAKTHMSKLLARVEAGEEIVIARGRTEVAKLVSARAEPRKMTPGWLRNDSGGSDPLAYGFWDPIPEVELALWNGELDYPDADAPAA